jgi:hypothetical protein
MTARNRSHLTAATLLVLTLLGLALARRENALRSEARRLWSRQHLAEIAARVAEPAWPANELGRLKPAVAGQFDDGDSWLTDRIIRMRNGDWLAYSNVCRKEPARIHDLFLARGSDGTWYYSTYHFCAGMVALRMELQPKSLPEFTTNFFLRTFDGRSEECLQKTWPPARR